MIEDKIYIEDILLLDINQLDSITLINYNTCCIYFAQKIFIDFGDKIDIIISDILTYLIWMSNTSSLLARKIMQPKIYKDKNKNIISRSSYIFCDETVDCKKFYGKSESCKKHHYVHSIVKNDIDTLITFIQNKIGNNISFSDNDKIDILISLKTIYFVFSHMSREANYINNLHNNFDNVHKNNINIKNISNNNINKSVNIYDILTQETL